jgi:hypothetical protein
LRHKRLLAVLAAAATLGACTTAPATRTIPSSAPVSPAQPSAQLGTLAPAYPPGTDVEPGVEVLPAIPANELSTTAPIPIVPPDMCANVPADVVTAAGLDPTPTADDDIDRCVWRGSGLGLEIGAVTYTMAEEVADHVAMSTGRSGDPLAHLAWLRIGDHYAIERILKFDRAASCWLSLDLSIEGSAFAVVYRVSPSGNPVNAAPADSVEEICPITRKIAKKLLNHLDDQPHRKLTKPVRPSE